MLTEEEVQFIRDNAMNLSRTEIARRLKCSVGTVRRWIRKERLPAKEQQQWNEDKRKKILELNQQGFTRIEIAKLMNMTHGAVRGQLNIMRKNGFHVPYRKEWIKARKKY